MIKSTTPIASLQSYQVVLVRVTSVPALERYTPLLELSAADAILSKCNFARVVGPSQLAQLANLSPDLIVDLRIRQSVRGGSGFITNPNLAVVDVTMVLSDGEDESLLGSTEIQGKSSGIGTGQNPESEALVAVAKRVSSVLAYSGCVGQRAARAITQAPPVAQPGPGLAPIPPEELAQAEADNDEGKRLFRSADIASAKEYFLRAAALVPDPRFYFNLCLAHEALAELEQALQSCTRVLEYSPTPKLADKATQRLQILAEMRQNRGR